MKGIQHIESPIVTIPTSVTAYFSTITPS